MSIKYIKYNENGEYGFYIPEVHGKDFCKNECREITNEFYNFLLENQGEYLIDITSVVDTVTQKNLIERPMETIEQTVTLEQKNRADIDYICMMMGVSL